jgi:hypothetical protein
MDGPHDAGDPVGTSHAARVSKAPHDLY